MPGACSAPSRSMPAERLAREAPAFQAVAVNPRAGGSVRHALPGRVRGGQHLRPVPRSRVHRRRAVRRARRALHVPATRATTSMACNVWRAPPSAAAPSSSPRRRPRRRCQQRLPTCSCPSSTACAKFIPASRPARATSASLLPCALIINYADNPARMKERGRWREFYYWSQPQRVEFPALLGRRRAYLCDRLTSICFQSATARRR